MLMMLLPPTSTLSPYTTLFRSHPGSRRALARVQPDRSKAVGYQSIETVVAIAQVQIVRVGLERVLRVCALDRKSTRLNSSRVDIVCRLLLAKKNRMRRTATTSH